MEEFIDGSTLTQTSKQAWKEEPRQMMKLLREFVLEHRAFTKKKEESPVPATRPPSR